MYDILKKLFVNVIVYILIFMWIFYNNFIRCYVIKTQILFYLAK